MRQYSQKVVKIKPGLKLLGKAVLLVAFRYGPAGVAGWAVKSVARKPLKILLALTIEPLVIRVLRKLSARYNMDENRVRKAP